MMEVGNPNVPITFLGANQLAGSGRLWKTGPRGLNFNNPVGNPGFAGGITHSNGNIIIQSRNSLGQDALRVQVAGNYNNLLLQLAAGEHVISNDMLFDLRSANLGYTVNSSGDINTMQNQVTYVGKFARVYPGFLGLYISLGADRAGFLNYSTNIYAGDWSGLTNMEVRIGRGVHIFAVSNAVPPATSFIEINNVNGIRGLSRTLRGWSLQDPLMSPAAFVLNGRCPTPSRPASLRQ